MQDRHKFPCDKGAIRRVGQRLENGVDVAKSIVEVVEDQEMVVFGKGTDEASRISERGVAGSWTSSR